MRAGEGEEPRPEPRGRSLACSVGKHDVCDGNAPNGPAGIGSPCACVCRHAGEEPRAPQPDLPERVVVGANGAYWRDYGTHYSMPPVSEDNDPFEPVAIYVRARWSEAMRAEERSAIPVPAQPDLRPLVDDLALYVLATPAPSGTEQEADRQRLIARLDATLYPRATPVPAVAASGLPSREAVKRILPYLYMLSKPTYRPTYQDIAKSIVTELLGETTP